MESLYLLIPLSLLFVGVAVAIFFWAVKSGQYDDLQRESERILFDDEEELKTPNKPKILKKPQKPELQAKDSRD